MRDVSDPGCAFRSSASPRLLTSGLLAGAVLSALQLVSPAEGVRGAGLRWLTLAAGLALSALFGRALYNRARSPVFEIRDGGLEWGSIFRARSARRRLALRDIARLEPDGAHRLRVVTHSGARLSIPLHEVPLAQRPALGRALSRALAGGAQPGPAR